MKKHYLLLIGSLILSMASLSAQNLKGSTWTGSLPFAPSITMEFNLNDTLYFTYPSGKFAWATYVVNGNMVSFREQDTATGGCGDTVGVYNYVIQADSLVFSAVSESCAGRAFLLENYKWKNAGVSLSELKLETAVYPNPFKHSIHLNLPEASKLMKYSLTDLSGKQILKGELHHQNPSIETGSIPQGTYILHIPSIKFSFYLVKN